MASLRFTDVQARPSEFLDLTSLTRDEFHQLIPPFETAFHAHLAAWRLDGKPRITRRFTVYKNCPLPTPGRSPVLHSGLPQDLCAPGGARAPVRHGAEQGQPVDPRPPPGATGGPADPRRCPCPFPERPSPAARRLGGRRRYRGRPAGGGARPCGSRYGLDHGIGHFMLFEADSEARALAPPMPKLR
jgi:hypothetical protein